MAKTTTKSYKEQVLDILTMNKLKQKENKDYPSPLKYMKKDPLVNVVKPSILNGTAKTFRHRKTDKLSPKPSVTFNIDEDNHNKDSRKRKATPYHITSKKLKKLKCKKVVFDSSESCDDILDVSTTGSVSSEETVASDVDTFSPSTSEYKKKLNIRLGKLAGQIKKNITSKSSNKDKFDATFGHQQEKSDIKMKWRNKSMIHSSSSDFDFSVEDLEDSDCFPDSFLNDSKKITLTNRFTKAKNRFDDEVLSTPVINLKNNPVVKSLEIQKFKEKPSLLINKKSKLSPDVSFKHKNSKDISVPEIVDSKSYRDNRSIVFESTDLDSSISSDSEDCSSFMKSLSKEATSAKHAVVDSCDQFNNMHILQFPSLICSDDSCQPDSESMNDTSKDEFSSDIEDDSLNNENDHICAKKTINSDENSNTDKSENELEQFLEGIPQLENIPGLNKDDSNKINYYLVKSGTIIILHKHMLLNFHGVVSVTVLYGSVEVLGHTLTIGCKDVEMFSPRGTSFLNLHVNKHYVTMEKLDIHNILITNGLKHSIANDISNDFHSDSAIILCKKLEKPFLKYLEKHVPQQVFPHIEEDEPCCKFQSYEGTWNVMKIGHSWDSIISTVTETSRLLVCGGKGVGKSTFLRYMVNRLLPQYGKIIVIDLDPGQPEFTVPGCVSATVVEKPLLGPNYTHLKKPIKCVFVGQIDITYEPNEYLTNVKELLLSCHDLPVAPVLINYMGYSRALGLDLVAAVIALSMPTVVVQMESKYAPRNFKDRLTVELVEQRARLLVPTVNFIQKYNLVVVESVTDNYQGWQLQPRQIREMCVLSYLSQMFSDSVLSLTDTRVPIYTIGLLSVVLICNGKEADPAIVNANLVALCSQKDGYKSYICHGWGVVRGINLMSNELYLITPLSLDDLEPVEFIILGSVFLPPSVYMTADGNQGIIPYISQGLLTTLGKIPKRTHLPVKWKSPEKSI